MSPNRRPITSPANPEGEAIYDVEVEDLGPVARDAHGAMLLERSDLTDRAEF